MRFHRFVVGWLIFAWLGVAAEGQTVFSASGANAAAIQPTVDAFRSTLGTLNLNSAGSFPNGRREINWDGVPAASAAPNNLAANFFNVNSPRGVVFTTPGTGFQVSGATNDSGAGQPAAANFGNINPGYTTMFAPFSGQRLFTALGSNIVDVIFFVPGSTTPALVSGFGAVFSDVDLANTTAIQFFDGAGTSLGTFFVPSSSGNQTFSFLGVVFPTSRVGRIRITCGNQALSASNTANDVVAMDDFIYGEPQNATPSPTPTATATATATPTATATATATATPTTTATPTATATASPIATPNPTTLANISTRLRVEIGDNLLFAGFIITGAQPKKVIVLATGPSLTALGVLEAMANPTLELYQGNTLLDYNDNWIDSPNKQAITDSGVAPTNDLESAIIATLPANSSQYTAIVRGAGNTTGVATVQLFDLDRTLDSKLANISTRGLVQTGDNILIAGTIILGQTSQKIIIRAIGPSLGLPGKLADPTLELRDGNGDVLDSNDNWVDFPDRQAIIDSTIPPTNDLESAIVATLPSNGAQYTAIVRGVGGTAGIAVVEIFALQ